MKECALIFAGGSVDLPWAKEFLKKRTYSLIIAADGGLIYADALGIQPDVLLGDFDSAPAELLKKYCDVEKVQFPPEKDYTDFHLALSEAADRGAKKIEVLGATGTRLDHTLANIDLLKADGELGTRITLYDAHNKIYFCSAKDHPVAKIRRDEQYGRYVSFLPYSDEAQVSLSGMKYSLTHGKVHRGASLTVSNEIAQEEAVITVESGSILVFESRD